MGRWREEKEAEITRETLELRKNCERNQKLGPQILENLLTEHSQFIEVGAKGRPVTEPRRLTCQSCNTKFDWHKLSKEMFRGFGGERLSIDEKALPGFLERELYQPGVTSSGLFCFHEIRVHDTGRDGRAILGSERKQPCGARLLAEYRILHLETKRH